MYKVESSLLLNHLKHKPCELTLMKHLRNLIDLEMISFTETGPDRVGELAKTVNTSFLFHLPSFSIYEIFMMLNGAEMGLLEISVYLVFIIRYFEEVLPMKKQFKEEDFGPVRDDLGIGLVLALDAKNRSESGQEQFQHPDKSKLPQLKGQHMSIIRYRVLDTIVFRVY